MATAYGRKGGRRERVEQLARGQSQNPLPYSLSGPCQDPSRRARRKGGLYDPARQPTAPSPSRSARLRCWSPRRYHWSASARSQTSSTRVDTELVRDCFKAMFHHPETRSRLDLHVPAARPALPSRRSPGGPLTATDLLVGGRHVITRRAGFHQSAASRLISNWRHSCYYRGTPSDGQVPAPIVVFERAELGVKSLWPVLVGQASSRDADVGELSL